MLDKEQHISFFGPSLLRLSVNMFDAELYRCSLASDVGGADCQTSSVLQHVRCWYRWWFLRHQSHAVGYLLLSTGVIHRNM